MWGGGLGKEKGRESLTFTNTSYAPDTSQVASFSLNKGPMRYRLTLSFYTGRNGSSEIAYLAPGHTTRK